MTPCSLALVLLLDMSGSVTPQDWQHQVEGHARALQAAPVREAIIANGPVAVRADAFSDYRHELAGWTLLRTEGDVSGFAATLRAGGRQVFPQGDTLTAQALEDSVDAFEGAPCAPDQRVIDLVTDGVPSDRPRMGFVRHNLDEAGVRVNALFVETARGRADSARAGWDNGLDWLREEVVTGGGVAMSADGWNDFTRQIRMKVVLEIAGVNSEEIGNTTLAGSFVVQ